MAKWRHLETGPRDILTRMTQADGGRAHHLAEGDGCVATYCCLPLSRNMDDRIRERHLAGLHNYGPVRRCQRG